MTKWPWFSDSCIATIKYEPKTTPSMLQDVSALLISKSCTVVIPHLKCSMMDGWLTNSQYIWWLHYQWNVSPCWYVAWSWSLAWFLKLFSLGLLPLKLVQLIFSGPWICSWDLCTLTPYLLAPLGPDLNLPTKDNHYFSFTFNILQSFLSLDIHQLYYYTSGRRCIWQSK